MNAQQRCPARLESGEVLMWHLTEVQWAGLVLLVVGVTWLLVSIVAACVGKK